MHGFYPQRPLDLQVQSQVASLDDSEHDATMTYDHTPDDDGDSNRTREFDEEERAAGQFKDSQGQVPQDGQTPAPDSQASPPQNRGHVPQCHQPLAPGNR